MTREELKEHCEKQIEMCEMWAIAKGEEPSRKVYEEHKLILELLKQQTCDCAISRADMEQTVEDNILCYTHSDRPIDQDPDTECHMAIRAALRMLRKDLRKLPPVTPRSLNPEADREESKAYCAECDHIEMCSWYPHDGCEWLKTDRYNAGYNAAKREIALSGEYERAYERGKADAQPKPIECEDAISRQAAIDEIKSHYRVDNDLLEVIAYKISKLPPVQPKLIECEDAISRADALSEISSYFITEEDENGTTYQMAYEDGVNAAYEAVEKLPLVTSKQKMGHWIKITPSGIYMCSECEQNVLTGDIDVYHYCHHCGIKMINEREKS